MSARADFLVQRIVSGGQTGVDRAALDVALHVGIPCGGWCPRGRRAEDGRIPDRYPLQETPSEAYEQRTRWNVRDTDGTLIIVPVPLQGGTKLTWDHAHTLSKPIHHVAIYDGHAIESVQAWCRAHSVHTLNIAGPRASEGVEVYRQSFVFLLRLLG